MIEICAGEIAAAAGGSVVRGTERTTITDVRTDSRSVRSGSFFVPLRGERFDGHDYIEAALRGGARGFMYESGREIGQWKDTAHTIIAVSDTVDAYGRIGRLVRDKTGAAVVGITGSTGKTSTKDLLAAVLADPATVVATYENRNNEIGVPATLLRATARTRAIIVEMGMRGAGQIATLAGWARPDIGIITNVGVGHFELLGSREAIAAAKSELAAAVSRRGHVILNADDPWTPYIKDRTSACVITFGLDPEADFSVEDLSCDESGRPSWRLKVKGSREGLFPASLPFPGPYNVPNALAAIAAGSLLGVPTSEALERLSAARLTGKRLDILQTLGGVTVVDGSYNANPDSMAGALDALVSIRPRSRHIAVLGKMAELGPLSDGEHERLGVKAAGLQLDMLIGVGEEAARIIDSARAAGLAPDAARHFKSKEEAGAWLRGRTRSGDIVLVKGSRVAGLETIVSGLMEDE